MSRRRGSDQPEIIKKTKSGKVRGSGGVGVRGLLVIGRENLRDPSEGSHRTKGVAVPGRRDSECRCPKEEIERRRARVADGRGTKGIGMALRDCTPGPGVQILFLL